MELYFNKKKVGMPQNPSAYLVERNKVLLAAGANTEKVYATTLDSVVKSVTGKSDIKKDNPECRATTKQTWVKSLAHDMAVKLASIQVSDIIRPRSPRTLESWKPKRSLSRKGVSNYIHN